MNYTWDLSVLYEGFDDPKFISDTEKLGAAISELSLFARDAETAAHAEFLLKYIDLNETITD